MHTCYFLKNSFFFESVLKHKTSSVVHRRLNLHIFVVFKYLKDCNFHILRQRVIFEIVTDIYCSNPLESKTILYCTIRIVQLRIRPRQASKCYWLDLTWLDVTNNFHWLDLDRLYLTWLEFLLAWHLSKDQTMAGFF
jgi:hypothetical protein